MKSSYQPQESPYHNNTISQLGTLRHTTFCCSCTQEKLRLMFVNEKPMLYIFCLGNQYPPLYINTLTCNQTIVAEFEYFHQCITDLYPDYKILNSRKSVGKIDHWSL